jgi:hypothetical protein
MFQFFHADVTKVDQDAVCVAIIVHVSCKRLSLMFHLFFCTRVLQVFQTHVSSVSSVFFCILQMLHLDVSKVDQDGAKVAMVFQLYVPNVLSVLNVCCKGFIWMLQK